MAKLEVATDRIATRKPFAHPNHGTRRVRPTPDRPSGRRPARSEHPDGHEVEWLRLTPVVLPAMSEILTVQELAERFELSENTVRRAIEAGRLRAAKSGGDAPNGGGWRITLEDARACFGSSAEPSLKTLYREFLAAKSARRAAKATEATAERAN